MLSIATEVVLYLVSSVELVEKYGNCRKVINLDQRQSVSVADYEQVFFEEANLR